MTIPFSDRPLDPGEKDLLKREDFVSNLARVIASAPADDSIVFALYGAWGEGKTSALNLLLKEFQTRLEDGEAAPVVIRFNPWIFSGRDTLP